MQQFSSLTQNSLDLAGFYKTYTIHLHQLFNGQKIRTREVIALERFRRHCRLMYETLYENCRVSINELNGILKVRNAPRTLKKAFDEHYIVGPEVRKMALANFPEYMYFVNCRNPDSPYRNYRQDENVIFHALMYGFANLW